MKKAKQIIITQEKYVFVIYGLKKKEAQIFKTYDFNCRWHSEYQAFVVYRYYDDKHPNPHWSGKKTEAELKRFIKDYEIDDSNLEFYYDKSQGEIT